jgi:hypothetical protein
MFSKRSFPNPYRFFVDVINTGDDIYRKFVQVTGISPQGGLCVKMTFYVEHFMVLSGLIVRPHYTSSLDVCSLHPLGLVQSGLSYTAD